MFTKPNLQYNRIKDLKELLANSYRTQFTSNETLIKCQNNGQIAFSDEHGVIYATPYRGEVHVLLYLAGYKNGTLFVPFSNGEIRPAEYQKLANIAEAKNWAETYEEAYKIASQKGIQPVILNQDITIKELSRAYIEQTTRKLYCPLASMFLHNQSRENIGTYIIDDKNTIVVCDEYSRTFILKSELQSEIEDVVNVLYAAGYTQNEHPKYYILDLNPQMNS